MTDEHCDDGELIPLDETSAEYVEDPGAANLHWMKERFEEWVSELRQRDDFPEGIEHVGIVFDGTDEEAGVRFIGGTLDPLHPACMVGMLTRMASMMGQMLARQAIAEQYPQSQNPGAN